MASDSAVTVRWDNAGNPAETVVPRDSSQALPHTAGKTYADIDRRIQTAAASTFGADNGLGGLSWTVSQTKNLQNQSVTVSFTGAKPVEGASGGPSTYLQVFQCWGRPGADGKPDPNATEPDPATCQFGAVGADGDISTPAHQRALLADPLVKGGDWEAPDAVVPRMNLPAPFLSITGEQTRITDGFGLSEYRNPFFSRTSTNEHSLFLATGARGEGSRTFELQTGAEASGLGCGYRADAPSVSKCWLVAVPRSGTIDKVLKAGPLAPSLWGLRMQVPLHFQNVGASCSSDQAATLSFGSENLTAAMKSWIPGICEDKGFTVGFTPMADMQARKQLEGANPLAFTIQPAANVKKAVHAPAALSGVVVAMTVDNPCTREYSDLVARVCGYANEAEFEADKAKNGALVRDLKLNARLLAKLLTQSYIAHTAPALVEDAPFKKPGTTEYGQPMPYSVQQDPEFQKLNPKGLGSAASLSPPIVEGLRSDAAAAVWDWILNQKSARAFLEGCPDPWGMVINPYYSMRTYDSCEDQAQSLDAAAERKIADAKEPANFNYAKPVYPSDSAAYPQVYWAERPAVRLADGTVEQPALTVGDQYATVHDMAAAANYTVRAQPASVTNWCMDCTPPAFKLVPRESFGNRNVISITDSASAAKFQLPTAQLCDAEGTSCVGADNRSLTRAAQDFEPTGTPGVLRPDRTPDIAGGAYPLTVPVYGAVNASLATPAEAAKYAELFGYIGGPGQQQGFRAGMLPPGYAPLTATLHKQLDEAVTVLKGLARGTMTLKDLPVMDRSAAGGAGSAILPLSLGGPPADALAPAAASVPAAAESPAKAAPVAKGADAAQPVPLAGGVTARAGSAWPQHGLLIGLGVALAAVVSSSLLARGRRS
ncbi:hypothetical protein [Sinomonas halotolerans]|uniref:PBP domain-containing protein n=1 Tax=Sinomonas halotolerans TaxID=1644133 RepID=A0ABU9X0U8_9MICC